MQTNSDDCPNGPHRGPQGPNEDVSVCGTCLAPTYEMRPESETYGDHLPDCSLPRQHESYCSPGGYGHPTAQVIRGYWPERWGNVERYWPERCGNVEPHGRHEWYGPPASAIRRDCPGVPIQPRPPKPEPMVCPHCSKVTDWIWDDADNDSEWVINGQWWFDPEQPISRAGYLCSRRCYLARMKG